MRASPWSYTVCVCDRLKQPDGFNFFRSDKCIWTILANSSVQQVAFNFYHNVRGIV